MKLEMNLLSYLGNSGATIPVCWKKGLFLWFEDKKNMDRVKIGEPYIVSHNNDSATGVYADFQVVNKETNSEQIRKKSTTNFSGVIHGQTHVFVVAVACVYGDVKSYVKDPKKMFRTGNGVDFFYISFTDGEKTSPKLHPRLSKAGMYEITLGDNPETLVLKDERITVKLIQHKSVKTLVEPETPSGQTDKRETYCWFL